MTPFSAHLCLYPQMIDIPRFSTGYANHPRSLPPSPLCTSFLLLLLLLLASLILRRCRTGQPSLIAMYARAMGSHAVERYALLLTSLTPSADPIERRRALQRAGVHGLDTT